LLDRWHLLQQRVQHFWKMWSRDYLAMLQVRAKWYTVHANLKEGQTVILHDENLPPCRWKIALIEKLHPGSDGLVRAVTLRTSQGVLSRPILKLSPLPISE
jgi:Family of unknown function (DUF5641)